jgi:DNA-binding CsgD family transcriptional regulator
MLPMELRPGVPRLVDWSDIAIHCSLLDMREHYDGSIAELRRRYDVGYSAVTLIEAEDAVEYLLYVSRGALAEIYDSEDLAFLGLVAGHFGRALKLRQELIKAQIINEFQSDTLDRLGLAAILVASNRSFTPLNKKARQMLSEAEGLRACNGQLHIVDERDDRLFQSMLKESLAFEGGERTRAMLIEGRGESRDLNLLVSARRSVSALSDRAETCALVFVRRSSVASDADVEVLQQLFSFTRAEAKLALGLAKGKRLEDVESELNIRHNTARAHLRSMFVKADVNRRSELIHLLATSLAPLGRHLETPSISRAL